MSAAHINEYHPSTRTSLETSEHARSEARQRRREQRALRRFGRFGRGDQGRPPDNWTTYHGVAHAQQQLTVNRF